MKFKTTILAFITLLTVAFLFSCQVASTAQPSEPTPPTKPVDYNFSRDIVIKDGGQGVILDSSAKSGSYTSGTTLTVEASASKDSIFLGWYTDMEATALVSKATKYTFTIKSNTKLYACFKQEPYIIWQKEMYVKGQQLYPDFDVNIGFLDRGATVDAQCWYGDGWNTPSDGGIIGTYTKPVE